MWNENSETAVQFEVKIDQKTYLKYKFWISNQNHDFADNGEIPGLAKFRNFSRIRVHSFADKFGFKNQISIGSNGMSN